MSADPAIVAHLESLDARRAAATLAKDRATLESLYAPDCHYVHSSATDETAALFIERACTGHYDYRKLQVVKREWRTWSDTALCNGDVEIEVMAGAREGDLGAVFAWDEGSFRIEADAELAIVTDRDPDGLALIRHSTAHLLAFDSVQGRWRAPISADGADALPPGAPLQPG